MRSIEEKRDEACIEYVGFGYGCDGDTNADSFKAGWDACAKEYDAVLEDTKLKIEGDFRKEIAAMKEHYDLIIERCNYIADLDGKDYAVLLSEKENLRLHLLSECKNHKLTLEENTELKKQLEIAKEALNFYAEFFGNFKPNDTPQDLIINWGHTAQEALKVINNG